MPSISFVVARSRHDHIIGYENTLPWNLKSDLKLFRDVTYGHVVIMGRKTFESIGKPLKGRINVVLSRRKHAMDDSTIWVPDVETALFVADYFTILSGKKDAFVVGGSKVYEEFIKLFDKIYLTEVLTSNIKGDTFFDYKFDRRMWKLLESRDFPMSPVDQFPFSFGLWEKKKKFTRYRYPKKFLTRDLKLDEWFSRQPKYLRRNFLQPKLTEAVHPAFNFQR